jgi:hypothetical protein
MKATGYFLLNFLIVFTGCALLTQGKGTGSTAWNVVFLLLAAGIILLQYRTLGFLYNRLKPVFWLAIPMIHLVSMLAFLLFGSLLIGAMGGFTTGAGGKAPGLASAFDGMLRAAFATLLVGAPLGLIVCAPAIVLNYLASPFLFTTRRPPADFANHRT